MDNPNLEGCPLIFFTFNNVFDGSICGRSLIFTTVLQGISEAFCTASYSTLFAVNFE